MKTIKHILIAFIAIATLHSCAGGGDQSANAEGFASLEKEIKSKFGDDAYYTDLSIMYIASIGNSIAVTVTEDPASLEMGEWTYSRGSWTQTSEITLEIPEGSQAKDFMFQLNEAISLKTLGGLIEKSAAQLSEEKNIENPTLSIASVYYPDNGDISKARFQFSLEPENGGTSFSYFYKFNGEFIEMNY